MNAVLVAQSRAPSSSSPSSPLASQSTQYLLSSSLSILVSRSCNRSWTTFSRSRSARLEDEEEDPPERREELIMGARSVWRSPEERVCSSSHQSLFSQSGLFFSLSSFLGILNLKQPPLEPAETGLPTRKGPYELKISVVWKIIRYSVKMSVTVWLNVYL